VTRAASDQAQAAGRTIYAAYIKEQLDAQEARKSSLEQRGLAVISTSGVLVTLLFGLTALSVKRAPKFEIPTTAATFLVLALVFFVLASVSALITNLPRSYQGATVQGLRSAVTDRWDDDEAKASRKVARTRLDVIAAAKDVNKQKAWALVAAMVLEIIAVALVGMAMSFVLLD
jgi:hypothetical protein